MKKSLKWLPLSLLFISIQAYAIDLNHILKEIKGFLGSQLVKAVCMIKRDCHQRVIYVVNPTPKTITLNGCHFDANTQLGPGEKKFTHRKNSKGKSCVLEVSRDGELDTKVNLNPYNQDVNFEKQGHLRCVTAHTVLKSWQKCPVFHCGKYEVMGYVAVCSTLP